MNMLLSVSGFFTSFLYILLAIVVLLFMILIHELGHYTAGKLLKFKINEFSIGFGKAIFKKTKKNGEVFSLRIFPLGGFCSFEGEDEDKKEVVGAFNSQKPWKRLIVLFMGAFFNFLSAIIFALILLTTYGYSDRVQVTSVSVPKSVVQNSQNWLQEGDVIHAVNGKETNFINDEYFFVLIENFKAKQDFEVSVYRNGEDIKLTIYKSWFETENKEEIINGKKQKVYALDGTDNYNYYVEFDERVGKYKIYNVNSPNGVTKTIENEDEPITLTFGSGEEKYEKEYQLLFALDEQGNFLQDENGNKIPILTSAKVGITTKNYVYGFFEGLGKTFEFCFGWAWKILKALFELITGQIALKEMGGTITTVKLMATSSQANIINLLLLIPVISINLAVFNLLPIPALDGARMVFVLIEMIRKKPINRELEGKIHFIGLLVLLGFVIIMDILQLFVFRRF